MALNVNGERFEEEVFVVSLRRSERGGGNYLYAIWNKSEISDELVHNVLADVVHHGGGRIARVYRIDSICDCHSESEVYYEKVKGRKGDNSEFPF